MAPCGENEVRAALSPPFFAPRKMTPHNFHILVSIHKCFSRSASEVGQPVDARSRFHQQAHQDPPLGPPPGVIVVFDTNVVVEAVFWPRSMARRALTGLAKRRFQTVMNSAIMEEYAGITAQVREKLFSKTQPSGALAWIAAKAD